ncbi:PREDICTED: uncharacterized protein LOC108566358 [Nicrophorus vespilloides]|uniref:Uncharacterized protein LOC108566358 n=1 Tax=Nicrophorus vespilloides TaxID=110193 RepID=A0ABM1N4D8_NICVS|nr:PREDICTED: uncharacterized protein LOC108566358 [Nicrophorus vespilloides]
MERSIAKRIMAQKLVDLEMSKSNTSRKSVDIQKALAELREVTVHPRYTSLIQVVDLLYMDALLSTSDFMMKHQDYKIVVSQSQAFNHLRYLQDEFQKTEENTDNAIVQIKKRLKLMEELDGPIMQVMDNAVLVQRGEHVEIIETDNKPIKRERVARFRTSAERDEYIKTLKFFRKALTWNRYKVLNNLMLS